MSFDLAVWVVPAPVTVDEARAEYERLCGVDELSPVDALHPAVAAFHHALTALHPEFDADSTDERAGASPWASGLCPMGTAVLMAISWSRADELAPMVRSLAAEHGLTVYDPQRRLVHGPAAAGPLPTAVPVLTRCDGTTWADPDPGRIELVLRELTLANWYAVYEREPNHYVQVARGGTYEGRIGEFVLEHRAGSPEEHYRVVLTDLRAIVSVFQRYARGDAGWRDAVAWERYEVPPAGD